MLPRCPESTCAGLPGGVSNLRTAIACAGGALGMQPVQAGRFLRNFQENIRYVKSGNVIRPYGADADRRADLPSPKSY